MVDMVSLGIGLTILAIWEAVWKGIALWHCGKRGHLVWFILIFVLNTIGILPIIYLLIYHYKVKPKSAPVKKTKKKKR